jgi:glutathione reductase (NADPH)
VNASNPPSKSSTNAEASPPTGERRSSLDLLAGSSAAAESYDYDLFVIGGGSGGVRAARVAATHGARVGIAEQRYWGGTCVNVGCVPKKLMTMASHFSADFRDSAEFGWVVPPARHDWPTLIRHKNEEIARLNGVYRELLSSAGCTLFDDRATFVDAHTLRVGRSTITADKILVAAGAWPVLTEDPGVREHAFTSNEVFELEQMPRRVLIVGGGYIGVEFAGIFRGLGADVTLVCRSDWLLKGFDRDLAVHLVTEMRKRGVAVHLTTDIESIGKADGGLRATLGDGTFIDVDCAMYAVGRKPSTDGLGAKAAGIALDRDGAIVVDEGYRTSISNVYAIGDVTDRVNLTPSAIAEGHALADTLFGGLPHAPSYENIPSAVFSDPPVGAVGLTESAARERYGDVDIYRSEFRPLRHAIAGRDERTFVKLIVDRRTDKVLGCHMVGEEAPEIIQGFAVALNCGATKSQFDATIGVHPSAAEEFVTMRNKSK